MSAPTPTAAGSGRSATERFSQKEVRAGAVDQARISAIATDVIQALHEVIRKHHVHYAEYDALKAWLIRVGEDGEWPLFLDVWLEHVVEEVVNADRLGTSGTIEGPYYIPGSPEFRSEASLPMRDGEKGTPFLFQGTVTDLDGAPLEDARVELWHADDDGFYSQFAPGIPEWNLRGTITTGPDGHFAFHTVRPAPYQIPTDGACGALIAAAGWHAWRPAHLHLKVSAPGTQLVTTQLYFEGGEHVEDDVAQAVKPELVLRPTPASSGTGEEVTYDFALDPAA
ncbi:catechol 1,2-dioxygenase [Geodermatophilus sp. DSM 44513]|uniref:catechol 1,2-dioxygenase n=1 Tax=Geodermatophilus sp. DSM 44513 TaxID=1528104 RepID=UPI00127528A4|nr:catechol 1,2-dioxygenase [Geodermatophilus sp. DSM 44513]WNV77068.1 catechol 1,2-dioxygenase [Geodermatophilus sp. DSM 44513]